MAETSADLVLPQPLRGRDVAAMSNEDIMGRLDLLFRQKAAVDGAIVVLLGEVGRREAYRDEGATAAEPWVVERFGVSTPTERAYTHVAERAWDLPHLVTSLSEGEITFDKLRAVSDVATPGTDREMRDRARECSVRQLAELARRHVQTRMHFQTPVHAQTSRLTLGCGRLTSWLDSEPSSSRSTDANDEWSNGEGLRSELAPDRDRNGHDRPGRSQALPIARIHPPGT